MATSDAAAAHVRFLVVRDLPMVVVDLEPPDEGDTSRGGPDRALFDALVDRGLLVLPRFYGHALPRGARVGLTLDGSELRLEDERGTRLLRAPREAVPAAWLEAARRLRGTMLYVGRDLGVDADQTVREVCDLLESAAPGRRVAGAIIGVAEQPQVLPLIG